jgi:triacylglycerol lipase
MLPENNLAGYSPAQIMMTLASISYVIAPFKANIITELAKPGYATQSDWQLAWGPVLHVKSDNLMYVAKLNGAEEYAVVVRGTDLSPINIHVLKEPYVPDALVAEGTIYGLAALTGMRDADRGKTVLEFLSVCPPSSIYVTGHSLGGCLTTVIALWLKYQFASSSVPQTDILAYTFAAPSAGNQQFADWYTNNSGVISYRYFNTIDLIPMAWTNVPGIKDLFPPSPTCPIEMKLAVDAAIDLLRLDGVSYVQPNGQGTPLTATSQQNLDWFAEVGTQHGHNNYLQLLGAPQIDF